MQAQLHTLGKSQVPQPSYWSHRVLQPTGVHMQLLSIPGCILSYASHIPNLALVICDRPKTLCKMPRIHAVQLLSIHPHCVLLTEGPSCGCTGMLAAWET